MNGGRGRANAEGACEVACASGTFARRRNAWGMSLVASRDRTVVMKARIVVGQVVERVQVVETGEV